MGRKRKAKDPSSVKLPPCRICEAPGAGFHYGVNTCEACKGFYQRSLQMHKYYKCRGKSKNCVVKEGLGSICQYCRFQKCLKFGMSKTAIKTGRYTSTKRTKDFLEIKAIKSGKKMPGSSADMEIHQEKLFPATNENCTTQRMSLRSSQSKNLSTEGPTNDDSSRSDQGMDTTFQTNIPSSMASTSSFQPDCDFPTPDSSVSPPSLDLLTVLCMDQDPSPPEGSPDPGSVDKHFIDNLYASKDAVASILLDAYHKHIATSFGHVPDEERVKQEKKCYEDYKLKTETFGALRVLDDKEYDEVFQETGIDADGRQHILKDLGPLLEETIKAQVKFAKAIPGFSLLKMEEKVHLVKNSRIEFSMFLNYNYVNPSLRVCKGLDNTWRAADEYNSQEYKELCNESMEFCSRCQKLNLTIEEQVITSASILMAPDHGLPSSSSLANHIHWNLIQVLIHVLEKRHAKPMKHFAKLMDIITDSRTFDLKFRELYKDLAQKKYSKDTFDRPLLREIILTE